MKKILLICSISFALCGYYSKDLICDDQDVIKQRSLPEIMSDIHWLGHDAFRIEWNGLNIYIDPYKLKEGPEADVILITHDHGDHCSLEDIKKIQKEDTLIITVEAAKEKLSGKIELVKPGDEIVVRGVKVKVVPAYNINKFRSPGVPFHPRESGYAGFIITLDDQRIYHAGDTDLIPEMSSIETDVALLPVSGIYVMTAGEAVEAVKEIKAEVAIPMHLGRGIGSMDSAQYFKDKANILVEVLPIE